MFLGPNALVAGAPKYYNIDELQFGEMGKIFMVATVSSTSSSLYHHDPYTIKYRFWKSRVMCIVIQTG